MLAYTSGDGAGGFHRATAGDIKRSTACPPVAGARLGESRRVHHQARAPGGASPTTGIPARVRSPYRAGVPAAARWELRIVGPPCDLRHGSLAGQSKVPGFNIDDPRPRTPYDAAGKPAMAIRRTATSVTVGADRLRRVDGRPPRQHVGSPLVRLGWTLTQVSLTAGNQAGDRFLEALAVAIARKDGGATACISLW
jgi:hypothetical protein